ncbi:MAG: hypothetical protein JW795_06130 [Chitinivibrionales bacterium]|nr:hypothetical protein [Chitinivibrionales bacterium]
MDNTLSPVPTYQEFHAALVEARKALDACCRMITDQELLILAADAIQHSFTYEEKGYH